MKRKLQTISNIDIKLKIKDHSNSEVDKETGHHNRRKHLPLWKISMLIYRRMKNINRKK